MEYRTPGDVACDSCGNAAVCCESLTVDHVASTSLETVIGSTEHAPGDTLTGVIGDASDQVRAPSTDASTEQATTTLEGGTAPKPAGAATSVLVPETDATPAKPNAPQPTAEPSLQPVEPAPAPPTETPEPAEKSETKPVLTPKPAEDPASPVPQATPAPAPSVPPAPPAAPAKPREENIFDEDEGDGPGDAATTADDAAAGVAEAADGAGVAADPRSTNAPDAAAPALEQPPLTLDPEPTLEAEPEVEAAPAPTDEVPSSDEATATQRIPAPTRAVVLDPPTPTARRPEPPLRRWVDVTGAHATVGRFRRFDDDSVEILKSDGRVIRVPLDRLSESDRAYVGTVANSAATPAVGDTVGM